MPSEPLNPGARHHLKRTNFIAQATEHFRFLCDRHGYTGPEHSMTQQAIAANGRHSTRLNRGLLDSLQSKVKRRQESSVKNASRVSHSSSMRYMCQ